MSIPDLLAKLEGLDASLGDGRDVLSTADAQARFWTEKRAIAAAISGLRNAPGDLEKPLARLADAEARRAIVLKAQAEVERLIAEQPDWRAIRDARQRDREWGRQQDLLASRRALVRGVEYMGGVVCVPNALKSILGVTVEPDGREVPYWYGTLPEVEEEIAKWAQRRDAAQAALDAYVRQAEALLAAAPVVAAPQQVLSR